MVLGEIIFNLGSIQSGEEIQVYSKGEDLFRNEKIDIYTIGRGRDGGIYIKFDKKTSLDGVNGYSSKENVAKIGVAAYTEDKWQEMNLSNSEIESLKHNSFENGIIRRGYALEGQFESGLHFKYPNIIMVTLKDGVNYSPLKLH
ncbi:hypothetical protein CLMAG_35210 [Clostridium magnum DSM 2767]|uniref:Uncharacterized protein n=2 Tax=Clostridium magnum TaxID=33954 RepID=A0A161YM89_9CLOT|nr:hypothetical protein CLMAG_35210 [Clostridium magnum DSM 2767]SHJ02664.1 hypothetical protein SAMN02745944_05228 [Clostridium magnum DSM 2767]